MKQLLKDLHIFPNKIRVINGLCYADDYSKHSFERVIKCKVNTRPSHMFKPSIYTLVLDYRLTDTRYKAYVLDDNITGFWIRLGNLYDMEKKGDIEFL